LRPVLIASGVAAVMGAAGCGSTTHPSTTAGAARSGPSSATATVVMTKLLSFGPQKLTVAAGTTVTWRVGDGIDHTVTTGSFTVGGDGLRTAENPDGTIDAPLTKDRPVSHTFTAPGTYRYYCSIHKGMNGTIDVTP
jgi:plastocyanin